MSLMLVQQEIIVPEYRHTQIFFPHFKQAYQDVIAHYATLPSADNPPEEQFSQRDCRLLTRRFMDFLKGEIPNERLMKGYMASMIENGYAHNTIVKYMVYARHFCNALAQQELDTDIPMNVYLHNSELRYKVLTSANLRNPAKRRKVENEQSVYSTGKRLKQEEAQSILDHIDKSTLQGKRDAAFFMVAFTTGFRLSELARITLNSINEFAPGEFSIKVRAKGNKYFARAVATSAIRAMHDYVNNYNAQLAPTDPRRIKPDEAVWKPLTRSSGIFAAPRKGLSTRAISKLIEKRSLAPDPIGKSCLIEPHDIRRTWAAWADALDMDDENIQQQMLHESLQQTKEYIARPRDVSAQDITKYGLTLHL